MKKNFWRCFLIALFMAFAFMAEKPGINAQAAAGFVKLNYDGITRAGGRYFEYKGSRLYYGSSSSNINVWIADSVYDVCTDGNTVYYVKDRVLTRYSIPSGKNSALKRLSSRWNWDVSTVYGKNIYLFKADELLDGASTYVYNTKTKKLKKIASGAEIEYRSGKYAVVSQTFSTGYTDRKISIFRLTSTGMKKVKTLGKCLCPRVVKGKVFYMKYTSPKSRGVALYRCNANGKGIVRIGSFSAESTYGVVEIDNYTVENGKVSFFYHGSRYTYTIGKKA